MSKTKAILLFGVMSAVLGAVAGAIIYIILKIIALGTDLLWSFGTLNIFYNLAICIIGGLLIGLWQKKNGIYPHDTEQVFAIMKKDGRYPYDKLGVIAIAVIMPLIFGGALGPEAGLTGLIAGLCYWVSDSLKRRGDALSALMKSAGDDSSDIIAETGISVVLSIIFKAPLFGISGNLESSDGISATRKRLVSKKSRIFIYCMGVLGGFLSAIAIGKLISLLADLSGNEFFIEFANGGGLPRFQSGSFLGHLNLSDIAFFVPFFIIGVLLAFIYLLFNKATSALALKIADKRILSCIIAGACVAILGAILPGTMFSGEHQLGSLISGVSGDNPLLLILTAVFKLLLVCICINFGWRGGSIFPIIYSGASAALGVAAVFSFSDGAFAAAILISAMYAYISRKPFTSVLILLLCFPVSYIIPMLIAAFVASLIPSPFAEKAEEI